MKGILVELDRAHIIDCHHVMFLKIDGFHFHIFVWRIHFVRLVE